MGLRDPFLEGLPRGILTNERGNTGPGSGRLWGTVIGAVAAVVVIAATGGFGAGVTPQLIGLGAETGPGPPVAPRQFPGPPGMAQLVNPLLQVPFQLGSRDPGGGHLDCWGLVSHLLKEGRGLTVPEDAQGRVRFLNALTPVWVQTGHQHDWWLRKIHSWDVVLWVDLAAMPALGWDMQAQGPLAHCGLVCNPEVLVAATIDLGVALFETRRIAEHYGEAVGAVLRPPAVPKGRPYGPL